MPRIFSALVLAMASPCSLAVVTIGTITELPCSKFVDASTSYTTARSSPGNAEALEHAAQVYGLFSGAIFGYVSAVASERQRADLTSMDSQDVQLKVSQACNAKPSMRFGDAIAQVVNASAVATKIPALGVNQPRTLQVSGSPLPFILTDRFSVVQKSVQIIRCEQSGSLMECVVRNISNGSLRDDDFPVRSVTSEGVIIGTTTLFLGQLGRGDAVRSRPISLQSGSDRAARIELGVK